MDNGILKIFSGSSNPALTREICNYIGLAPGEIELKSFSDGEKSVKISENVRGADVFVIQATSNPANEYIIELMLILDALRRASAQRITVVMPYYGYGRQDRKVEPRVPISAKVIAKMVETVGADRVLAMDLHADQIQGFFDIPVDHLFAATVLINYFMELKMENLVIVSPDSGGAERARFFAKYLNAELAIIDKRRERANESEVMHIIGDVNGKDCIIIDDMIDTAGTIVNGANALVKAGASRVLAAASHGVLSGPAIERLKNSKIEQIVLTNSIHLPDEKKLPNMKILSVASLIGDAIQYIHNEMSVSTLFLKKIKKND